MTATGWIGDEREERREAREEAGGIIWARDDNKTAVLGNGEIS